MVILFYLWPVNKCHTLQNIEYLANLFFKGSGVVYLVCVAAKDEQDHWAFRTLAYVSNEFCTIINYNLRIWLLNDLIWIFYKQILILCGTIYQICEF